MTNVTTVRYARRPLVVGVPGETKPGEHRVAVTPDGVCELARRGVPVLVEAGAGLDSGIGDGEYRAAGAEVLDRAVDVWACADLVWCAPSTSRRSTSSTTCAAGLCSSLICTLPRTRRRQRRSSGRGSPRSRTRPCKRAPVPCHCSRPWPRWPGGWRPGSGPGSSSASPGDGPAARRGPPRRGGPRTRRGGLLLHRGGCPGTPPSGAADTPGCRSRRRLGRHVTRTHTYGEGRPAQP
jgi:hypothetical protein